MANVSIDASIKVKWPQGQSSYSPGNPEELAIIALDLLVKELGTRAARLFIAQVFERYSEEHPLGHPALACPANVLLQIP